MKNLEKKLSASNAVNKTDILSKKTNRVTKLRAIWRPHYPLHGVRRWWYTEYLARVFPDRAKLLSIAQPASMRDDPYHTQTRAHVTSWWAQSINPAFIAQFSDNLAALVWEAPLMNGDGTQRTDWQEDHTTDISCCCVVCWRKCSQKYSQNNNKHVSDENKAAINAPTWHHNKDDTGCHGWRCDVMISLWRGALERRGRDSINIYSFKSARTLQQHKDVRLYWALQINFGWKLIQRTGHAVMQYIGNVPTI